MLGAKYEALFLMKQIMCVLLALLTMTQVAFADSDPCEKSVTDNEINACVKTKLDIADQKLNDTYKQLMELLSKPDFRGRSNEYAKKNIIKAQRHWINLRDIDCDVVSFLNSDGTVRTYLYLQCKVEMTQQREVHLRTWFLQDLINSR